MESKIKDFVELLKRTISPTPIEKRKLEAGIQITIIEHGIGVIILALTDLNDKVDMADQIDLRGEQHENYDDVRANIYNAKDAVDTALLDIRYKLDSLDRAVDRVFKEIDKAAEREEKESMSEKDKDDFNNPGYPIGS